MHVACMKYVVRTQHSMLYAKCGVIYKTALAFGAMYVECIYVEFCSSNSKIFQDFCAVLSAQ